MPTGSSRPDIEIPSVGIWDFLFERKQKPFADDKVVLIDADTSRSYTYASLRSTALDFGKGLKALWDWQRGEVLALYTPNCIDTAAVTWGCHFAGGTVSPANPGYMASELAFQLKDSGAKALVTQLPHIKIALEACKQVGIPEDRIILLGDAKDETSRYKHFTSIRNTSGATRYRRTKVDPEKDLAFLVYSSGTTGHPKGVMLCHRNIVANVLQQAAHEPELNANPRPNQAGSHLAVLPFFHIYGLTVLLHQTVYKGLQCVVMAKFDLEKWCDTVQKYKIGAAYVAPPIILGLAKHPAVEKYDLSSLKMLSSGAAPLTKDLVDAAYKRLSIPIKQGYGLSETSPTTHLQPWHLWDKTIGSVGTMLPNQTAMYMSAEEKELPVGETGELWIKGPNVFVGYLNNPTGTANAITPDGWFKTGDVGYQDKDGNFYITDRVKELIKYKGFQVPPAELEGYLASHPQINDVAVIGVFMPAQATEVPLAYVVPKPGEEASEKEIVEWLGKKVANHKKLRGGVRFVEEIPKSAAGKILRRVLKERYLKEEKDAEEKKEGRAKL